MIRITWLGLLSSYVLATNLVLADSAVDGAPRGPGAIVVEEPLLKARSKLLKNGWKPVRRHATDGYEYSGAELQLTRSAIFEVDSCSSDSSRCILFYKKNGKCLRMDTIGEKLTDMVVTRWVNECPDAQPKPEAASGISSD